MPPTYHVSPMVPLLTAAPAADDEEEEEGETEEGVITAIPSGAAAAAGDRGIEESGVQGEGAALGTWPLVPAGGLVL